MLTTEETEIRSAIAALKIKMYKGSMLICPKCNRRGDFGSIVTFQTEAGNKYIICGWCGEVSPYTDNQKNTEKSNKEE